MSREVKTRASRIPVDAARERFLTYLEQYRTHTLMLGPSLQPCVCGAARHEHSGPARTGKCEAAGCARYRRDVVDALVERAIVGWHSTLGDDLMESDRREHEGRPRPVDGGWGIGPSDAGGCRAAIGFRERGWGTDPAHRLHHERGDAGAPEGTTWYRRDPEDFAAARVGTLIHTDALRRREALYPWRDYGDKPGRSIAIPGLDRHGRFDEYDPITGLLVDIKTAGNWKWEKVNETGPDESQWDQIMLYGLACSRAGRPVTEVELAFLERAGGRDLPFRRPYNEARALDVLNRLIATAGSLDMGESLPRDRPGPSLDALCRRCFARSACWQVPQATAAGRSPESWVRLGMTPREQEVAAVLEEYDAGRKVESDGKAQKAAAKAQLEGIPHGAYGEWKYGYSGGNRLDPAPDLEGRAVQLQDAMLDAIAEGRPPVDPYDLPHPMTERTSRVSVTVKRLSAKDRQAREAATPEHAKHTLQPLDGDDGIVDAEVVSEVADGEQQPAIEAAPAPRRVVIDHTGALVQSQVDDDVALSIAVGVA